MKIIVAGAGIGGLQAAKLLAEKGFDVTVYEKCKREELSYDWIDDVEPTVFSDLDFPLPPSHFRSASTSFAVPMSEKVLRISLPEEKREWSVERREFSEMLTTRAENAGAKVIFGREIDSLIIKEDSVVGVTVSGVQELADLVIDSSGALSKLRASLPRQFRITPQPQKNEVFFAYRAFYDSTDAPPPRDVKKLYLKHLGEDGISWCFVEPNGESNVLIGRIGELKPQALTAALDALKRDNPIIGKNLIRGGGVYTIPVRYFLSRMVANGYAAIGDAAFMTMPMIGSGISNSLRAGKFLAETLIENNAPTVSNLWKYQYRYVAEVGAAQVMVDSIKRMLLAADVDDVRFLFDSEIIGDSEMDSIQAGEDMALTPAQILDKLKRGWTRLGLLISLVRAITRGQKAEKIARAIPLHFDENEVAKWQNKLDKIYGN